MNRLTPLEIQRTSFPRRMHGLDPDAVREFLSSIAQQVEEDNRTRGELKAQVARLSSELEEYRKRTDALSEALVAAQKAAEATVAHAEERAQQIIMDAEALADRFLTDAARRSENIELVITQLRERRRSARADLKRLAELIEGVVRDDEAAEKETAEPPTLALHRPRRREGKLER